jgi:catabolite regulation protein CreA
VLFKTLQVVRFLDKQRNALVYVAYSDRIIEGSPKNSISSVPNHELAGAVAVRGGRRKKEDRAAQRATVAEKRRKKA